MAVSHSFFQRTIMDKSSKYGVVLVTTSSQDEAEKIASTLVNHQLAACVNIFSVRSIYAWEGKVQNEPEWQLVIKTDLALFSQLEAKIQELHSYTVPEIIVLPIVQGSQGYLQWISDNVVTPEAT
jgi:periplasmic divalent cation tolerance protein